MEIEDSLFFRLKNQTMSIHENVSSRHPAKTRMPPSNPHFPRVQPGLNQGIKPDKAKYSTKGQTCSHSGPKNLGLKRYKSFDESKPHPAPCVTTTW